MAYIADHEGVNGFSKFDFNAANIIENSNPCNGPSFPSRVNVIDNENLVEAMTHDSDNECSVEAMTHEDTVLPRGKS